MGDLKGVVGDGEESVYTYSPLWPIGLSGVDKRERGPVHTVNIKPFRQCKYTVTFAQWDACVADGGCGDYRPHDRGWGRGSRPVITVSWDDAKAFIDWLNAKTGGNYRLPTEAEWEYTARAGTKTDYSWGNRFLRNRANCPFYRSKWGDKMTAPVGSFPANGWGLYDMHGNVWEWTEDRWRDNYEGAPSDGSAWITMSNSDTRVNRSGSWQNDSENLRCARRYGMERSCRDFQQGFRLAQDI